MAKPPGLIAVSWMDTNLVSYMTNCVSPNTFELSRKAQKNTTRELTSRDLLPSVAAIYRQHYHACDIFNNFVTEGIIKHRSRKWYHTVFWYLVKFTVTNSQRMHKLLGNHLTQEEFQTELYRSLAKLAHVKLVDARSNTEAKPLSTSFQHWMLHAKQASTCKFCLHSKHKKSNTTYYCSHCNVYLHQSCFVLYHNLTSQK